METMNVICAACDKEFLAPTEKAGKHVKCPGCSASIELPDGDGVAHALGSADDPTRTPVGAAGAGRDALPPVAIAAAIAAGIAGALIWAGISVATDYEIGYVAWAVGGMVGGAAMFMGAAGRTAGIVCGVIALVSIVGGRFGSTWWGFHTSLEESYAEHIVDAELWANVDSSKRSDVRTYMIERAYIDPPASKEDIDVFLEFTAPELEEAHTNPPDKAEWIASTREFWSELSGGDVVVTSFKESLGLIDLLFAFLGISTAFGLVAKRGEG